MESVQQSVLKNPENGSGTFFLPLPIKNKKLNKNSKIPNNKNSIKYISKTVKVKENYFNITSTNAAGLVHKSEDLKDKIKFFNSGIFAIQETHYRKKGKFKMNDYLIFESIRKNKESGGTMLGVHVGLQPILIQEYNEAFELLVVEIKIADQEIQVITGYGPKKTGNPMKEPHFILHWRKRLQLLSCRVDQ